MDKEKDEIPYPERYEYMREVVAPYREQIFRCNQQIDKLSLQNTPKPDKPTLHYNPYGSGMSRYQPSVTPAYWEKQKEGHLKDLERALAAYTKDIDLEDQVSIREAVRNDIDRNPFRGKSIAELQKDRNQEKDLSTSQNYSVRLLELAKKQREQEKNSKPSKIEEKQPEAPKPNPIKWELKFEKYLENLKEVSPKEPSASRRKDRDVEKD
ncbi:MAG: hypothetical protein ABS46_18685 [Cytophagaceae bacterium SCN 52-12]|nr:MAG: hypothetical protein ABS46_18685 [Cytophagaceae bacterium SCN 52-12]